jgi:hypothetical protein
MRTMAHRMFISMLNPLLLRIPSLYKNWIKGRNRVSA